MSTETRPDVDLEELLDNEIPCSGIHDNVIERDCSSAAHLRGFSHPCTSPLVSFKCIQCWQVWYRSITADIARCGGIRCQDCGKSFSDADAFVDFRPF